MAKKVGIMSMQRIINYGSFLQAYGLKSIIEGLNDREVQFVDYNYEKSLKEKENKIERIIKKVKINKNIINFMYKRKNIKRLKKVIDENLVKIGVTGYNYNPNIDKLVIGSDEVINCTQQYPVGYSRELFGKNYEHVDVISYAATFGYTTIDDLKKYCIDEEVGNMLEKFKAISVRDENSYGVVKELLNKESIIHLDPVLVANYSDVIPEIKEKNYIIIYAYPNRLTKEEEKFIKKFAKKHKKKIISLGFYQRIADKNLVVSPFEVLAYFKNADYVITDTFHGTIFSVKMNTKFCTIIRESNKNKLKFLLKKLEQEERIVNNVEDIELFYNKEKKILYKK